MSSLPSRLHTRTATMLALFSEDSGFPETSTISWR
jgi:hypothetical protein